MNYIFKLQNCATININQLSSIPIYKAIAKCSIFNQPSIQTQCPQLNYTLVYPKEYSTTASFIIDSFTVKKHINNLFAFIHKFRFLNILLEYPFY